MNANSICKGVEVLNGISFSKFLKQVDGKNWRVQLQVTDQGNPNVHKKGRTMNDPAFSK
jgi:hypothetical protein